MMWFRLWLRLIAWQCHWRQNGLHFDAEGNGFAAGTDGFAGAGDDFGADGFAGAGDDFGADGFAGANDGFCGQRGFSQPRLRTTARHP